MIVNTNDRNKQDKIQWISVVVIVAGIAALVQMHHNTQETEKDVEVIELQIGQEEHDSIDFRTTAGAGDLLNTDLLQSALWMTAGAADILDEDFGADTHMAADDGMTADGQAANSTVEEDGYALTQDNAQESEYANLAIAKVHNYVNVRSEPNTDSEVVGKMYDGSVAQILSIIKNVEGVEGTAAAENNTWFQVVSGNVEGYIKAEYFIYGEDAVAVIDDYITRYAVVSADRLNVRENPDITAGRIGYIDNGERVKLVEWGDEWSKVNYAQDQTGYVASAYVTIAEEFIYAKSIAEEQAELAAQQELQARAQASEEAAPERAVISVPPPQTNYENVSELRAAVVDYAMQYLGNKYVHGGQSLETGTDCSGFTCYVYKAFGYSLSRTPQGQYTAAGREIDMSQIQPGDVICYSSNGSKCTHVGLYIGNGQIIHAANSRKGVIISNYDYDGVILGVRSIVD